MGDAPKAETGKGPARGYSWPPFEKGHELSVKHGTRSERLVAARAAEIREQLLEAHEFLAQAIFTEALERYCRLEARARMLDSYIVDLVEEKGVETVPKTLWDSATRVDMAAAKAGQDCGLDPSGFARAARDLGFAKSLGQQQNAKRLTALSETGRALREGNAS